MILIDIAALVTAPKKARPQALHRSSFTKCQLVSTNRKQPCEKLDFTGKEWYTQKKSVKICEICGYSWYPVNFG